MAAIYELLEQDHQEVKDTLKKIKESTDGAAKTRSNLFAKIKQDLEIHTQFEEEVFYPKARKATHMDEEIDDDLEEHEEADELLDEISRLEPTSKEWMAKIEELSEALSHHIEDEEQKLFPGCREALGAEAAETMGQQYESMKKSAMEKA